MWKDLIQIALVLTLLVAMTTPVFLRASEEPQAPSVLSATDIETTGRVGSHVAVTAVPMGCPSSPSTTRPEET